MKKEIPALMSTIMVQAILEGRKTMTRRLRALDVINKNPDEWRFDQCFTHVGKYERDKYVFRFVNAMGEFIDIVCPYGRPGDLLWVRENFEIFSYNENNTTLSGRFLADDQSFNQIVIARDEWEKYCYWKKETGKKPSLFLFKSLSRIWLEVTDIRVERLQEISEEDAIAEGVEPNCTNPENCPSTTCAIHGCAAKGEYFNYLHEPDDFPAYSAKESFETLWRKINGEESWNQNPRVWVVSFKVLSTKGKPARPEPYKQTTDPKNYNFNQRNNLETSHY